MTPYTTVVLPPGTTVLVVVTMLAGEISEMPAGGPAGGLGCFAATPPSGRHLCSVTSQMNGNPARL